MHIPQNELLLYKLFLSHPDRSFYMQEIGRILKKKPGVFQRTLNKIEEEGFIQSEFIANARFFKLNTGYPVLKELTSIVKKMYGELDIYSRDIEKLDQEAKAHKALKETPKSHIKTAPPASPSFIEPGSFQDMLKKKIAKTKSLKKQKEADTTLPPKPGKRSITLSDYQSEEMLSSLKKPGEAIQDTNEKSEVPEKSEKKETRKKEPAHEASESPKAKKTFKRNLSSIWEEELKFHDAKKAQKKTLPTKEQLELF